MGLEYVCFFHSIPEASWEGKGYWATLIMLSCMENINFLDHQAT